MNIPLKQLKYTVAYGNFVLLILWTLLETWIIIRLILTLFYDPSLGNVWVYVMSSPVVFYLIITKFFGFYGSLYQNYLHVIIHIVLNTIYMTAIALSMIYLSVFDVERIHRPYLWQKILTTIHHLFNFILLILSVILFFKLRAMRTTTRSLMDAKAEDSTKTGSAGSASDTEKGPKSPSIYKEETRYYGSDVYQRLVPKKTPQQKNK